MSRQGLLKHLSTQMNTRMETVDAYMQSSAREPLRQAPHLAENASTWLKARYDLHQDCDSRSRPMRGSRRRIKRFDWEAGDVITSACTIHQHVNADPRTRRLISCINRIYKNQGLNDLEQIEDARNMTEGGAHRRVGAKYIEAAKKKVA